MEKFFSFKRFVTFGLGLGMFMSAASGFAQVTSSGTTVTIDAVGNGNVIIKDSTQVQGNISASGVISSSQAIQTTGTGSITSAYNLTAAGNKFNVAGDTGTVNVGNGKIVLNGANGNASVNGVALLNGGAYVGTRADNPALPALTVNGQGSFKGIDNGGQKITGVATGTASADAVNVGQLNALVGVVGGPLTTTFTPSVGNPVTITGSSVQQYVERMTYHSVNHAEGLDARLRNQVIGTRAETSANVHNNGVSGAQNIITTGPVGTVTQQLGSVVNTTAAAINTTNATISTLAGTVETNRLAAAQATADVQTNLNTTNGVVSGHTTAISNLQTTKADKTQVATDIATAKGEAIAAASADATTKAAATLTSANAYTDTKISATNANVTALTTTVTNLTSTVTTNAATAAAATARVQANLDTQVTRLDGRIDTTNTNLANETTIRRDEIARVDGRISDTNARVTAEVARLDDVKADKTAVATEVARVDGRIDAEIQDRIKGDADTLRSANTYTDNAVGALSNTVTREVTRVDGRIDTEAKIRADADITINKRIDTEAKTRGDADVAINKRIDVESTERKADVSNLNNRVDQEIVDRVEGDRQTLESANAHTTNQVSNERDRALAAESGLNRHINGLGAMTMAANAVAQTANPGDKKTSVGVGVGSYGGETAVAIGVTHTRHIEVEMSGEKRPVMVRYGATLSKSRASRTGFGVGASFSW